MKIRQVVYYLHLYVGLCVGLLLSLTGLTGSLLVFREEIEALVYPRLLRTEPPRQAGASRLSPRGVVERVRRAYPDRRIQSIHPPRTPSEVYEVWLTGRELRVYVDPHTGAVLGSRTARADPFSFFFDLHTHLLAGETGKTVVGIGGILLLLLGASGLILWWPGWQKLSRSLCVQWRANWKRINYDLHRVTGALAALLLGLIALTGAALVFSTFFADAAHWLTRTPRPPSKPLSTVRPGAEPLPVDRLVQQADTALPGAMTTRITIPGKPDAPFTVRKRLPGEMHPNGMCFVYIDQYDGKVLRVESAATAAAAPRLLNLRYPLHIGLYGGVVTRVLHTLAGLTPSLLFVTGGLMWWNRTRAKRRRVLGKRVRLERAGMERRSEFLDGRRE